MLKTSASRFRAGTAISVFGKRLLRFGADLQPFPEREDTGDKLSLNW